MRMDYFVHLPPSLCPFQADEKIMGDMGITSRTWQGTQLVTRFNSSFPLGKTSRVCVLFYYFGTWSHGVLADLEFTV